MKKEDFYIGQRVKQKDPDDGNMVYGHVTELKENCIYIKWNDLDEPVQHFESEYDSIKNGIPG